MPQVSVVLPAYNAERYLPDALESVLAQTFGGYECVVVDDGSADGTGEIADTYAARDRRVRVVHAPHEGLVAALNRGVDAASAPWIARMDADDLMGPRRLERQLAFAVENPALGLVASRANHLGDRASNEGMAQFVDWTNALVTEEQIAAYRFVESPLIHPTVMFRKEVFDAHGGYREGGFPEDYELWLRWLEAGVRMAKAPEVLFDWRERPERLTRNDDRYSVDAFHAVKAPYLWRWLAANNPRHPRVTVWGAGRTTRQRLRWLKELGLEIDAYVDIDPRKVGQVIEGRRVVAPEELPPPGAAYLLTCVGSRGARELIEGRLQDAGYVALRDYVCAA